jgi:hypothetical protein
MTETFLKKFDRLTAQTYVPRPWRTPDETSDVEAYPVDHEGCEVWPWHGNGDMRFAYFLVNHADAIRKVVELAKCHCLCDNLAEGLGPRCEAGAADQCWTCELQAVLAELEGGE